MQGFLRQNAEHQPETCGPLSRKGVRGCGDAARRRTGQENQDQNTGGDATTDQATHQLVPQRGTAGVQAVGEVTDRVEHHQNVRIVRQTVHPKQLAAGKTVALPEDIPGRDGVA